MCIPLLYYLSNSSSCSYSFRTRLFQNTSTAYTLDVPLSCPRFLSTFDQNTSVSSVGTLSLHCSFKEGPFCRKPMWLFTTNWSRASCHCAPHWSLAIRRHSENWRVVKIVEFGNSLATQETRMLTDLRATPSMILFSTCSSGLVWGPYCESDGQSVECPYKCLVAKECEMVNWKKMTRSTETREILSPVAWLLRGWFLWWPTSR